MKSVKDIVKELNGIVHKTQVIMDIRLGRFGITAQKVGNSYAIEDEVAKRYIKLRKKHALKSKRRALAISK